MEGSTVSSKFQVVIPKAIREDLDLKAGDRLVFFRKDGLVHLAKPMSLRRFRGIASGADPTHYRDKGDRPL